MAFAWKYWHSLSNLSKALLIHAFLPIALQYFHFETSSDEEEFEGFTPEDVIQSIEKGVRLQQINDDELSDISFDDNEWTDALSQIGLPEFNEPVGSAKAMMGKWTGLPKFIIPIGDIWNSCDTNKFVRTAASGKG